MHTLRFAAKKYVRASSLQSTTISFSQPSSLAFLSTNSPNNLSKTKRIDTTTNKKMSMKDIQEMHANKVNGVTLKDAIYTEKGKNAIRGADGFLEYQKVPPPWKDRKGPYKASYILEDANWIMRKSSKAHHVFGGVCIVFSAGIVLVEYTNPMLFL
jgi:hypothetical protein